MIGWPSQTQVYLPLGSTDMRKEINRLSVLVEGQLELDPFSGHLFVFCNRRRATVKVLFWDLVSHDARSRSGRRYTEGKPPQAGGMDAVPQRNVLARVPQCRPSSRTTIERLVRMSCVSLHSQKNTNGDVEPYYLFFTPDGLWNLRGYCRLRDGWRTFALDGIKARQVLDRTFLPKILADEVGEQLSKGFGSYLDGESVKVVPRFSQAYKIPYRAQDLASNARDKGAR